MFLKNRFLPHIKGVGVFTSKRTVTDKLYIKISIDFFLQLTLNLVIILHIFRTVLRGGKGMGRLFIDPNRR